MMQHIKTMTNNAKELLLKPEAFFKNLKTNKINWIFPLSVYFVYIIFNSLFLNYRPLNFPNELAVLDILNPSFLFYFGVQFFWGTLISVIFAVSVIFLIKFYTFKFSLALVSCLISVIAGTYILNNFDNFLLPVALLLIFLALSVLIIRTNVNGFIYLLKATFSVNLISFLFLPILFISVFLKSENLFLISNLIMAVWLLILFVKAVKTISAMSVIKTILIFCFSAIGAFGALYLLSKINLLSDNTFKVILSI